MTSPPWPSSDICRRTLRGVLLEMRTRDLMLLAVMLVDHRENLTRDVLDILEMRDHDRRNDQRNDRRNDRRNDQ